MNDIYKHTNPSWNEVLTEQGGRLPCSGNPRKTKMLNFLRGKYNGLLFYENDDLGNLYKQEFIYLSNYNQKTIKKFLNIEKFGHPKKCPAINKISNLIIF